MVARLGHSAKHLRMGLTDEQKQQVRAWAEEKATLSQIQERLRAEFGISMSYMETRLLVGDLDVKLAEKVEATPAAASAEKSPASPPAPTPAALGKVSVTVDELTPPFALISGKVTFSDGKRSDWYVDEMGRLALNPAQPGSRPSEQDVAEFQAQLRSLVQGRGL